MAVSLLYGAGNAVVPSSSNATSTTQVLTKPANLADGQFLLALLSARTLSVTITPPTGWSLAASDTSGSGVSVWWMYIKYIPTASAESATTYTFTFSASTVRSGVILLATGLDTTNFATPTSTAFSTTSSTSDPRVDTFPANTGGANDLAIGVSQIRGQSGTASTTYTGTGVVSNNSGASSVENIGCYHSTGTSSFTNSTSRADSVAMTAGKIAIITLPAATGATTSNTAGMTSTTAFAAATTNTIVETTAMSSPTAFAEAATNVVPETATFTSATAFAGTAAVAASDTGGWSSSSGFASAAPTTIDAIAESMTSVSAFAGGTPTEIVPETVSMTSATSLSDSTALIARATEAMLSVTSLGASASGSGAAAIAMSSTSTFTNLANLIAIETAAMLSVSNLGDAASRSAPGVASFQSSSAFAAGVTLFEQFAAAMASASAFAISAAGSSSQSAAMLSATGLGVTVAATYVDASAMLSATAMGDAGSLFGPTAAAMLSVTTFGPDTSPANITIVSSTTWVSSTAFGSDAVLVYTYACTLTMVSATAFAVDAVVTLLETASVLPPWVIDEDLWNAVGGDATAYVYGLRAQGVIMPLDVSELDRVDPYTGNMYGIEHDPYFGR